MFREREGLKRLLEKNSDQPRCDNVGSLDSRLGNIEAEIFRITRLQGSAHPHLTSENTSSTRESPTESPFHQKGDDEDILRHPLLTAPQIVRSDMTDHYYGSDTLYAWCTSFKDFVLAERQSRTTPKNPSASQGLDLVIDDDTDLLDQHIRQLFQCAETQDILDVDTGDSQILLPPKQFLLMLHSRLFQQNDWNTDLFVQTRFWNNVERVYTHYSPPLDEAWAILFNTIILLSLSTETPMNSHENLTSSQFAQPFFSTIRAAFKKFHMLLGPRLVNVQALALLSLVAELFYPPGVAECVFAQACILARQMGLNKVDTVGQGIDLTEQEERLKVYRSLYIRDKSLGISRGTVCWLPGFEIQRLSLDDPESAEASYNIARVRISAFQERVYRLHSAANAQGDFANKSGFHPSGIQNGLAELLEIGNIFGSDTSNVSDIDLWLEFLATRIIALRRNPKLSYVNRTLQDSRACCILLLMTYGKSNDAMGQRLKSLCDIPGGSQRSEPPISDPEKSTKQKTLLSSRNLLDIFPVSAFFLMAAHIIRPVTTEKSTTEDLDLLSRTYACYKGANENLQTVNRAHKIGEALGKLLEIVEHMNGMPLSRDPSISSPRTTATDNSRGTRSSQSFSQNPKTSDSFPEPMNMQQLLAHDYITSGSFSERQGPDRTSNSTSSFYPAGLDNMGSFMMNTQPSSGIEHTSHLHHNGNMMLFDDPDHHIVSSQFPSDNFGMNTLLSNDFIDPKEKL